MMFIDDMAAVSADSAEEEEEEDDYYNYDEECANFDFRPPPPPRQSPSEELKKDLERAIIEREKLQIEQTTKRPLSQDDAVNEIVKSLKEPKKKEVLWTEEKKREWQKSLNALNATRRKKCGPYKSRQKKVKLEPVTQKEVKKSSKRTFQRMMAAKTNPTQKSFKTRKTNSSKMNIAPYYAGGEAVYDNGDPYNASVRGFQPAQPSKKLRSQ